MTLQPRDGRGTAARSFTILMMLVGGLLLSSSLLASESRQATRCFDVPGIKDCMSDRFLTYWEQNGGLPVFGYPISAAIQETDAATGKAYLTTWFERNRLEYHPENQEPYNVLLGRLGDDLLRKQGRGAQSEPGESGPKAGCVWFAQTRHNVCDQGQGQGFKAYWQGHGLKDARLDAYARSLALFGLPLTEAKMEQSKGGVMLLTQWFERARFEWHPNNPAASRVLLGLLGNEVKEMNKPQQPPTSTPGSGRQPSPTQGGVPIPTIMVGGPRSAGDLQAQTRCSETDRRNGLADMRWSIAPTRGLEQRVVVTVYRDGFQSGRFDSSGPLAPGVSTLIWERLSPATVHYWRVLTRHTEGWVASETATFEGPTCVADNVETATPRP